MRRPSSPTTLSGDAVPLGERLRLTQYLRGAAVVLVLTCAGLAPDMLAPGRDEAVASTLAFAAVVLLAELVSRTPVGRRHAVLRPGDPAAVGTRCCCSR
jgi:hypothetical protein